jgi:hypothetical protein
VLEVKQPPEAIFRVARKPDAWEPPDWSRANPDFTFGNRFDDPEGYYSVLYAASQKLSCFLETLARYRLDLTLLAELNEISGEDDYLPLGQVPRELCDERSLGSASAEGDYVDICGAEWLALLRHQLAGQCLRFGLPDLDVSVLQGPARDHATRFSGCLSEELQWDLLSFAP